MTASLRELIERRIGLDPASLGPSVFADAIADGMRQAQVSDAEAYVKLLQHHPMMFARLLDQLVVPETWFFRGMALFTHLAELAEQRIAAGRFVRVLSLPCSTGEEPYSVVMTWLDHGLPTYRWSVEGRDIHPAAIQHAQRGLYREFSFRQTPPATRARYFRSTTDGWRLDESVRQKVSFQVANVLEPVSGPDDGYDVILCRNLLIYLTPSARCRALDHLERCLAPDGCLAVGHAEPSALAGRGYRPVGGEELFLFAKAAPIPAQSPTVRSTSLTLATHAQHSPQRHMGADPGPSPDQSPLQIARQLADNGQLTQAEAVCRTALQHSPSADGYALLGAILHAAKEYDAASQALRRALYLDPHHREALALAAGLAESAGNTTHAQLLRRRLASLTRTEPSGNAP